MSTYGGESGPRLKLKRKDDPKYGPFKIGDLSRKGYNKAVGKNEPYIEDPYIDEVLFQKDI